MENERERAKKIAAELNLKQKAALLYGRDFWYLRGSAARADLPDILLTDGPHGVRKQDEKKDMLGIAEGEKATVYPTGSIAACSWDEELLFQEGQMLGAECREKGVNVLLGPAINHIRDPRGGRNFEYLSEDPLLSGLLAAAYVRGLQGECVGACVKHFACNSQENYRMIMDGIIDERALREIYLKPFEIAVKNARPFALMTAYNKINGEYCSQNETLMNAAREWGFDGVFLTDWGAMREMSASYRAGLDAEMPGTNGSAQDISAAVLRGEMSEEVVAARAERVLGLLLKTARPEEKGRFCEKDGLSLAQKIAEQSAVLLKNEGALPLAEGEKIAVIGALAKFPRFQGAGSSRAEPYAVSDAYSALKEAGVCFEYARGYGENGEDSEEETARAVLAASRAEKAVVFAGLNDSSESEGRDRADISLPPAQNRLIERISAANPNTVVVLQCGSPVAMPWIKNVNAVLFTGLAGCMGGAACADLLTGKANPCGKLAQTFPLRAEDSPAFPDYGRHEEYAEYRESIFTGYRGYDAAQKEVLFPFGHGLSYTKFVYESLRLSKTEYRGGKIKVFATIFNAGNRDGREIVQLYVGKKGSSAIYRAEKELKGFYKLFLRAGERGEARFELDRSAFAYYDVSAKDWRVESGEYTVFLCASSRDVRLSAAVFVHGDVDAAVPPAPPEYFARPLGAISRESFLSLSGKQLPAPRQKTPFTPDTLFGDLKATRWGRFVLRFVLRAAVGRMDPASAEMQTEVMLQMPLSGMCMGTSFTRENCEGFADLLNGKIFRGMLKMLKKPKREKGKKAKKTDG